MKARPKARYWARLEVAATAVKMDSERKKLAINLQVCVLNTVKILDKENLMYYLPHHLATMTAIEQK